MVAYRNYLDASIRLGEALITGRESPGWGSNPQRLHRRTDEIGKLARYCLRFEICRPTEGLAELITRNKLTPEVAACLRILAFDSFKVPMIGRGLDLESLCRASSLLCLRRIKHGLVALRPGGILDRAEVISSIGSGRAIEAFVTLKNAAWEKIQNGLIPAGVLDHEKERPFSMSAETKRRKSHSRFTLQSARDRPLVLQREALRQFDQLVDLATNRSKVWQDLGLDDLLGPAGRSLYLFSGASGCGKTTAAEVLAYRLGRPMISLTSSELVDCHVGQTQKNITAAFAFAQKKGAVLVIDECDSLVLRRTSAERNFEVAFTNHFLATVERCDVVVVMTTNRLDAIDPAFERRLGEHIVFTAPGAAERAAILRKLSAPISFADDVDLDDIALHNDFTGGEARNIVAQVAAQLVDAASPVSKPQLIRAITEIRKRRFSQTIKRAIGFGAVAQC